MIDRPAIRSRPRSLVVPGWTSRAVAAVAAVAILGGCSRDGLSPAAGGDLGVPAGDGGAPVVSGCGFDQSPSAPGASRPRLLVHVKPGLRVLHRDGHWSTVFRFGEGITVPDRAWRMRHLLARGGSVAASVMWLAPSATSYTQEMVFLGGPDPAAPMVRWSRRWSGSFELDPALGPGGALSFWGEDRRGHVIEADGRERTIGDLSPLGAPLADGTLAVHPVDPEALVGAGWLAPDGARRWPLALPLWTPGFPVWAGEHLVYIGSEEGAPVLVSERPDRSAVFHLDVGTDPTRPPFLHVEGAFVLVTAGVEPYHQWRLDAARGVLSAVDAPPPPGQRPWAFTRGVSIDDAGGVLMLARDAFRGALHRSLDGGASWSQASMSVAEVLVVKHQGRGGTFLVAGSTQAFGGEMDWAPTPSAAQRADLSGDSVHLWRPAADVRIPLTDPRAQWMQLSPDGLCGVWWATPAVGEDVPRTLRYLDVSSGQHGVLLEVRAPEEIGPVAWVD